MQPIVNEALSWNRIFKTLEDKKVGILILVASILVFLLYIWLSQWDSFYRTIFVEEMNGGEAGRSAYLHGNWIGEGGSWQSAPYELFGSILIWLGLEGGGLSRFSMRMPFIICSAIAICQFGFLLRRISADSTIFMFATYSALALSPFLLNVVPTGLNENLFLVCLMTTLIIASSEEEPLNSRHPHAHQFLLAIACSSAVFVKFDGVIIPVIVGLWVLTRTILREITVKQFIAFIAGSVVMMAVFIGLEISLFGIANLTNSIEIASELNQKSQFRPPLELRIERMLVWFPKNLNLYLPGISILLGLSIAILGLSKEKLSPILQLSCMIVVGYFLFSYTFPLIYWKRLMLISPCALIILYGVATSIPAQSMSNPRFRAVLCLIGILSVFWGAAGMLSHFSGMWRVIPFWKDGNSISELAILATLIVPITIIIAFGWAQKVVKYGLGTICLLTIALGIRELALPKTTMARDIGQEITALVQNKSVVSDHQAFRFFAYMSQSKVMFTHENDPKFPQQIFDNISLTNPDYVVVSNSYNLNPQTISDKFPNYKEIQNFTHTHSQSIFMKAPYNIEISVFERTSPP